MPIGGFVIACHPDDRDAVVERLSGFPAIEIHGMDEKGNIVAVMDTTTSDEMDALSKTVSRMDEVLNVGLAYLNTEDEVD